MQAIKLKEKKLNIRKQYKKYPKYKDSGIEWIGEIPREWEAVKAKNFIKKQFAGVWGEDAVGNENDIPCLRVADFEYDKFTFKKVKTVRNIPRNQQNRILKNKSVLIEKSGGGEKTLVGRAIFFNSNKKMVCANFIDAVEVASETDPKYFTYLLASAYNSRLNLKSIKQNTGIQNLDTKNYFSEFFPKPSRNDQQKIAEYLDQKTELIDRIIEKKKKLIELLKEKRTAVINQAVTKGLDPNVEMVDSGVEWVDKISKEWDIRKMKYIGNAIIGLTYSPEDVCDESGMLVLRSSNIKNGKIELDATVYVNKKIPTKLFTRIGDILICARNGSRSLIGKNAVIDEKSTGLAFGAFMAIFRTRYWKFISYFLKSNMFMSQLSTTLTSTINQLTNSNLNNIVTTIPPLSEQKKITEYLDIETEKIDIIMQRVEKSINLLTEFKSSLISHVVTGKLRV